MDWIVTWILKKALTAVTELYKLLTSELGNFLQENIVSEIVEVFKYVAMILFAIALLMKFIQMQDEAVNGAIDLLAFFKGILLGTAFIALNSYLIDFFVVVIDLSNTAVSSISHSSAIKDPDFNTILGGGGASPIKTVFVLVAVIAAFVLAYQTLKRVVLALLYVCFNYFSVIGIVFSNYSMFSQNLMRFGGLCVVQFLQGIFFFAGIESVISYAPNGLDASEQSSLILPFFYFIACISVTKIADLITNSGLAGGGRGGIGQTMMMLRLLK